MGSSNVNTAVLLDRVGRSRELLEEISGMYTDERPALLEQLYAALDVGDAGALHRRAHRLKGTFGSLAADKACAIAGRVTDLARKGDLGRAREELDRLATEARNVEDELRRIEAQEWGEPLTSR